jgi:CRISPR system Cascade subunit CasC
MLIEIHAIQNHSPSNLNRDDLGAPKTCYFGGVLRSRISSQCIKRSIRTSDEFKALMGGIRTRQLAKIIAEKVTGKTEVKKRAAKILKGCGIAPKDEDRSDMLVYTTHDAVAEMVALLQNGNGQSDDDLATEFGRLISERTAVPDMALSGRMLETGVLKDTTVEAALQVAHAISTHEARPEVDYYVAADDIPGDDAGAGYVDEALFASACFYKYFSIDWEDLVENLNGYQGNQEHLAAHTVGAFIRGAALINPTGKQNSYAAHNLPDGILIELKNSPISYANAFAKPVPTKGDRDLVSQSIAQLGQYVRDIDVGYGEPSQRFWFSPNLRYPLTWQSMEEANGKVDRKDLPLTGQNFKSLDELVPAVVAALGHDWEEVRQVVVNPEAAS